MSRARAIHWVPDNNEIWKVEGGRFVRKARGLYFEAGGSTKSYWRIPPPNTDGPAELLGVHALKVTATKEINPRKCYEVGFSVTLTGNWIPNTPIYVMAVGGKRGNAIARRIDFDSYNLNEKFDIPGNFIVTFSKEDSLEPLLDIHLVDYWTDHLKRNLLVHHAFIKEVN